jgi:hypothetical protein
MKTPAMLHPTRKQRRFARPKRHRSSGSRVGDLLPRAAESAAGRLTGRRR